MNLRRSRILMYHSISQQTRDPYRVSTSPERFETQMRYLKRRSLRGVSMRELRRAIEAGSAKGLVGLTFDDGYKDFLREAVPILERFGFTATVFVVGGLMGEENTWDAEPRLSLMDADEVREASERGMEVGAHGMSHVELSGLKPELLEEEVNGSRQILGELLDETVDGFCYPYGNIDSAAIQAVRRARYTYACAVHEQIEQDSYDMFRIPVAERDHLLRFAPKLGIYPQYFRVRKFIFDRAG